MEIKQVNPLEGRKIDSKTKPKKIEPLLWVDNLITLTRGDISVISGAAKSRKTFFLVALIVALVKGTWCNIFRGRAKRVVLFDTEQSDSDAHVVFNRVQTMTQLEDPIEMYYLRGMSAQEMKEAITVWLNQNENVDIVFIDGIADLMTSINSEQESISLKDWLMNTSQRLNIHICCVLHGLHDGSKLRGHIGSELERKCEHVFGLTNEGNTTRVTPKLSRRRTYEDFSFYIAENLPVTSDGGLPVDINALPSNFIEGLGETKPEEQDASLF